MIKRILLVTAVVFILNCVAVPFFGTVEQEPEPYSKVKSVIITYEYYGLDKGTVTLSIKDNGSYVRRDETRIMTSNGDEKTYKYFYLLTPENFYQADLHSGNMAIRMDRPADLSTMILIPEILYGESAESFETEKRYKKEAEERVAEQLCQVYYDEISAEKYWIWNDIILKSESLDWETKKPSGKRAVSVELDPEFPKGTFEVLKNLEVIGR